MKLTQGGVALACLGIAVSIAVAISLILFATPKKVLRASEHHPNILIIVTDDQRQGLNVMNSTIQRFVEEGRTFPSASVTTPQCCPSRASILTGRFAHNHGVLSNQGMARALNQRTTLEYYLKQEGYRTAIFGKFLNGWGLNENPPYFDEWAIGSSRTYYDGRYRVNENVKSVPTYSTTYLRRKAIGFISEATNRHHPWLMYLAPFAPHTPSVAEEKYAHADVPRLHDNPAIEETDKGDKPPYVRQASASFARRSNTYQAQERTLLSVDDMVASVFDTLSATGQGRNTLAFFISDNGLFLGEHGLIAKSAPYLQSLDVPMMMRWPAAGIEGTVDRRLVANIDIAPTVLQATGFQGRSTVPMDGRSLLDSSWDRKRILNEFWSAKKSRRPTWASIRNGDFQYTEYYANGVVTYREYYNLRADKWQLDNILGDSDPSNDRNVGSVHHQLAVARVCIGTSGRAACP
jgi:arylsulfatase A-like enzyme